MEKQGAQFAIHVVNSQGRP